MTKQQPVAASILALATSLAQGSGLEGTFHSQWQSRYVTEGRDNLDSNPLVTAGVDLTLRDVTAGVWQGWANGSDYRENNLFVEYAPYVERWSPYLNVTYLHSSIHRGRTTWKPVPGFLHRSSPGYPCHWMAPGANRRPELSTP